MPYSDLRSRYEEAYSDTYNPAYLVDEWGNLKVQHVVEYESLDQYYEMYDRSHQPHDKFLTYRMALVQSCAILRARLAEQEQELESMGPEPGEIDESMWGG